MKEHWIIPCVVCFCIFNVFADDVSIEDDFNVNMALVPSGTFTDGLTKSNEATFMRECLEIYKKKTCKNKIIEFKDSILDLKVNQAVVESFYIDKYEVSVGEYVECMEAGVCDPPDVSVFSCPIWSTYLMYQVDPIYAHHPINCINATSAQTYCQWKEKRLPTASEWRKAARGSSDDRFFPWGDASPSCHLIATQLDKPECLWFPGGDFASCKQLGPAHPCYAVQRALISLWPVQSKPQGASPYGVLHMSGNVKEWVVGENSGGEKPTYYIQGSPFVTNRFNSSILHGYYTPIIDTEGSDLIGFRCAKSAD
jgi:formylglycine-generating enzyme required for sulfatase activity